MSIIKSGSGSDLWGVDSSKAARVSDYDVLGSYRDQKTTFYATTTSPAGIPGAVPAFYIAGVNSKLVVFQRLRITGLVATAIGAYSIAPLNKYRSAFTGGTITYLAATPLDSSTTFKPRALPLTYTAAPVLGLVTGPIGSAVTMVQASAAAAGGRPIALEWDFRNVGEVGGVILRGPDDGIAITLTQGSQAVTAIIETQWTEE